jgi:ABC-type nitrate/sulfonate/bicarbonate transport system substrate-binding protein
MTSIGLRRLTTWISLFLFASAGLARFAVAENPTKPIEDKFMAHPASAAPKKVNIIFAEATGSFIVLLAIAQQQGFFAKFGVDAQSVAAKGAVVPRLTNETPIGMIGEPAALLQSAGGADLRIVASFSEINLSGHLVARPEIKEPNDLRGKRIGVRVQGAGIWISTVLALEQLGLSPQRDNIATISIGSPVQILRALEDGGIDAALVTVAQSRDLKAKGFSVLLENYPDNISSFGGGLVASTTYMLANPDTVESVVAALTEALAFSKADKHHAEVMVAFKASLNISDATTAAINLRELKRKPYPSVVALKNMQRVISIHEPRVLALKIEDLIDARFVRKLDDNGVLDQQLAAYGVK